MICEIRQSFFKAFENRANRERQNVTAKTERNVATAQTERNVTTA